MLKLEKTCITYLIIYSQIIVKLMHTYNFLKSMTYTA